MDEWTEFEVALVSVSTCALLTFCMAYCLYVHVDNNEVHVIQRLQFMTQVTTAFLMVLSLLHLGLEVAVPQRVIWPSYGIARPAAEIALNLFGFFAVMHPFLRWVTLLHMLASIAFNAFATAAVHILIDCKDASICQSDTGFTMWQLYTLWFRAMVAIFLGIWLLLGVMALCVTQGWFSTRYPARLFDSSAPLSVVPESSGGTAHELLGINHTRAKQM